MKHWPYSWDRVLSIDRSMSRPVVIEYIFSSDASIRSALWLPTGLFVQLEPLSVPKAGDASLTNG